ncbi:hypothetical protein NDU88_000865 [Pleurodeles waltl]|uniref:Uncharacterized protein n=1 Tax=Pleurodeles waltl TaxID=8319 RepID=A0AAV7R9Y8_PLEWA|nr:hypothetical protein NDU88_000865 [Pleurodeles waltl]
MKSLSRPGSSPIKMTGNRKCDPPYGPQMRKEHIGLLAKMMEPNAAKRCKEAAGASLRKANNGAEPFKDGM